MFLGREKQRGAETTSEPKEPDFLTRLGLQSTELTAAVLGRGRSGIEQIAAQLRDRIDDTAWEGFRDLLVRNRIINRLNLRRLPSLLEDEEEDISFKRDSIIALNSRISAALSFYDQLEVIGKSSFSRGVPAEKLIEFLESGQVLEMLVQNAVDFKHARFSADNIAAAVLTGIDSIARKLRTRIEKISKKPITRDEDLQIRSEIERFAAVYHPTHQTYTIANFIRELMEKYSDFQIEEWLKKNINVFVNIVRNRMSEKYDESSNEDGSPRHIANIVHGIYEKKGRDHPDKFIRIYLHTFLTCDSENGQQGSGRVVRLNLPALREFFEERIARVQSDGYSLEKLQEMVMDECEKYISENAPESRKTEIRDVDGTITPKEYENNKELRRELREYIQGNTRIITSVGDPTNLLVNPTSCSPEIARHFEAWIHEDELIIPEEYYLYLRKLFGRKSEGGAEETDEMVEKRVEEILRNVDLYQESITDYLGIPSIMRSGLVRQANNFKDLVKIAYDSENEHSAIDRFEARRKIELAILINACEKTVHWQYRHHEAQEVKKTFEDPKADELKIDRNADLVGLKYIDLPPVDDEIEGVAKIYEDETELRGVVFEECNKKCVRLVKAKFAGVDCYLLPPLEEEEKEGDDPKEYIGFKKLSNMVSKAIRGSLRPDRITDLIRMTYVVDDMDDLQDLQTHIETYYVSSGRALKRENRYNRLTNVRSFNVRPNPVKSENYRALRYVAYIRIPDISGTRDIDVPVEIRILLKEDCAKEKSLYDPMSHERYQRRRLRKVVERLAPREVYGDLFYKKVRKQILPLTATEETVLKDTEDFKMAA